MPKHVVTPRHTLSHFPAFFPNNKFCLIAQRAGAYKRDLFGLPVPTSPTMSCRTYAGGLPSVNEIAAKLRAAARTESWRSCSISRLLRSQPCANGLISQPAGANSVVNRLVEIGLLTEITGYTRNRRFRFDPYLRLFEDGGEMGEM